MILSRVLALTITVACCSGCNVALDATEPTDAAFDIAAAPNDSPATITRSRQFDLTSKNGRTYRILVAEPIRPAPADGCPVVYVLDANAMFGTVVEASRLQKNLAPAIIVGIGYPTEGILDPDRRYLEYTPVTPPERLHQSPNEPQVKPNGTGGQDEFLAFIEDELKPAIESQYNINQRRQTIFGHSLGGRFVLHALFAKPGSFQTYLASSPSIWWGENSVLEQERAFAAAAASPADSPAISVFITAAELEQKFAPTTTPERAAFLTRARMVDNAKEMADRLTKLPDRHLTVEFREFLGENHGSVIPVAINRGLNFALRP